MLWPMATRWDDNDHDGHVDTVTYYSYFDNAVNGWLRANTGVDIRELDAIGVVAESSCRFLEELSFPDRLRIGLAVERLGRRSVTYTLGVYREGTGDDLHPVATGRLVHVYVDVNTRRPVPVPEQIRKTVNQLVVRRS